MVWKSGYWTSCPWGHWEWWSAQVANRQENTTAFSTSWTGKRKMEQKRKCEGEGSLRRSSPALSSLPLMLHFLSPFFQIWELRSGEALVGLYYCLIHQLHRLQPKPQWACIIHFPTEVSHNEAQETEPLSVQGHSHNNTFFQGEAKVVWWRHCCLYCTQLTYICVWLNRGFQGASSWNQTFWYLSTWNWSPSGLRARLRTGLMEGRRDPFAVWCGFFSKA